MNILFVYSIQKSIVRAQPLKGQEDIQMGLAQLTSFLKKSGHDTSLLILDRRYKKKNFSALEKKD